MCLAVLVGIGNAGLKPSRKDGAVQEEQHTMTIRKCGQWRMVLVNAVIAANEGDVIEVEDAEMAAEAHRVRHGKRLFVFVRPPAPEEVGYRIGQDDGEWS